MRSSVGGPHSRDRLDGQGSSRLAKSFKAPLEGISIRPLGFGGWQDDHGLVQGLETVLKDGSVLLMEDVTANMDPVVRGHTDNQAVKCCMVELAQGHSVGDQRLPGCVAVWDDVSGIK